MSKRPSPLGLSALLKPRDQRGPEGTWTPPPGTPLPLRDPNRSYGLKRTANFETGTDTDTDTVTGTGTGTDDDLFKLVGVPPSNEFEPVDVNSGSPPSQFTWPELFPCSPHFNPFNLPALTKLIRFGPDDKGFNPYDQEYRNEVGPGPLRRQHANHLPLLVLAPSKEWYESLGRDGQLVFVTVFDQAGDYLASLDEWAKIRRLSPDITAKLAAWFEEQLSKLE